ncbi:SRPBCC family protein [Chitinophaga sp.]|uniref:SRPBCC family protein n=1 Tax=Chitinophaga sp. TaxID=1869181 RepID=UPI0031DAB368
MKKLIYSIVAIIGLLGITAACLELFSSYKVSTSINLNAPVKTYQQITINASPEKVYQVMSDIDHWAQWQQDVTEPKLNGPFEKGSSFDWKSGGLTIHSTIHTAIPGQKIGWSGKALGAFAIHNWTFVAENGHTTVKVEESMEGWLVYVMRNKFQKGLETSLQVWLKNLKAKAEQ